ncbi:acyltransferase family protein, partial [Chenggangzhangella methanolivorans]|uniref:acyltransferase family protein n=1 Tax=Chenggangzhangella methanolivorans TaxID=1437009 RepID=UPI0036207521
MLYRPEIDGLRAVAVLSVLLYHAAGLVPGGFVGVDVFFVISGYVITKTIAADLAAGSFGLWSFYERRIRRIAPALGVTILATAAASAAILLPIDLEAMGKSAIAAALMVSNMLFWGQAGYFDAAAQAKPLLHTWSLGIEEQFYLIFPLLVAGLWRFARRAVVPVLAVLAAASFAASIWHLPVDPDDVFYLAPYRFWELLIGALIALRPARALEGSAFAFLGLGLIAGAVLLYDDKTLFPGLAALAPTLGAALAINGAREGMAAARLLAARPLVLVGKISYSLYLVHWPLIVLVEYRQDARLDATEAWLVIAVSLVLAWISWHFVEQPFRAKAAHPPRAETSDRAKPVTRPQL